jgi:hypothetical protein
LEAIKLKGLNMIDKIGYGYLCLREENLNLINNYMVDEVKLLSWCNNILFIVSFKVIPTHQWFQSFQIILNSPVASILSNYHELTKSFNHFNLSSTHQWLHSCTLLVIILIKLFLFLSVFNLSNNIEMEETKRMIDQYKKENKDQISKGKIKLVK